MNDDDDDVLPTNIVDSSSSKGDEAVGSGSLEVAPLKGNVKPLALGGKGLHIELAKLTNELRRVTTFDMGE
ncbi:hypothetical protein Q3G72_019145 [Acer saccharum]|nr:hypothetical protein Q3G72_019145 [Acer saccharum]